MINVAFLSTLHGWGEDFIQNWFVVMVGLVGAVDLYLRYLFFSYP